MSDETKAALDAALEAHILDEQDGGMLTDYALQARYVTMETLDASASGYFAEYSDHIPHHSALGLVKLHLLHLEHESFDHD
jgi:hypothetical protein